MDVKKIIQILIIALFVAILAVVLYANLSVTTSEKDHTAWEKSRKHFNKENN